MAKPLHLLLTCEHAGHEVPATYQELFQSHAALLRTHRGYDIGVLDFGRKLSAELGVPLLAASMSRLLVDLNRSTHHPNIFSFVTKGLPVAEKERILAEYYHPYRQQVLSAIDSHLQQDARVLHLALHSFTPMFKGVVRRGDLGLLYDPKRSDEARLCLEWQRLLTARLPGLRVRRNYPYRGNADALVTWLRRRYSASSYLGIELEINQRFPLVGTDIWSFVQGQLIVSTKKILSFV